jgi:hypothetical protein
MGTSVSRGDFDESGGERAFWSTIYTFDHNNVRGLVAPSRR